MALLFKLNILLIRDVIYSHLSISKLLKFNLLQK
nr:MAG TPA: hypothetical protein [Caudoviricetes sp.]